MWSPRCTFPFFLDCAVLFFTAALAGCGDFCIAGFSSNGNAMINITASNPPPSCSLPHGMVRPLALKAKVCESCPADERVQHVFLTLQGIQLRPETADARSPAIWVEIAPHLASEPRQIDLLDGSGPELLAENTTVAAGSYREVRLQFPSEAIEDGEKSATENRCGTAGWNCVVTAAGQVAPLRLPGSGTELLIPIQNAAGNSLLVLPDSKTELRLSLGPRQGLYFTDTEGWKPQFVLSGSASTERQEPAETQFSTRDY